MGSKRFAAVAAVAFVVGGGFAAPARAAEILNTAVVADGTLTAIFKDTEANSQIDIDQRDGYVVIANRWGWLDPGAGCTAVDGRTVRCKADVITGVSVAAGAGDDTITKTASVPGVLDGGPGDDVIKGGPTGGSGSNRLIGAAGKDWLVGGPDRDVLDGGLDGDLFGSDGGYATVSYGSRTARVVAGIGKGNGGEAGEGDVIDASVWEIEGGSGDDELTGDLGVALRSHSLLGGPGNDLLIAGHEGNVLVGGDGDDVLKATYGVYATSEFRGGDGRDEVTYAGRNEDLSISLDDVGNDGNGRDNVHSDVENLTGGWGADTLTGDDAANTIVGGGGDDVLVGAGGNDTLDGGYDSDTIEGGDGDDTIPAGPSDRAADTVHGGAGTDTVSYRDRSGYLSITLDGVADDGQWIGSGWEGDNIGTDVETVYGGTGSDTIVGNTGSNNLYGLSGNDTINGGDGIEGNDTVDGGDDTDACTADRGDASANCES